MHLKLAIIFSDIFGVVGILEVFCCLWIDIDTLLGNTCFILFLPWKMHWPEQLRYERFAGILEEVNSDADPFALEKVKSLQHPWHFLSILFHEPIHPTLAGHPVLKTELDQRHQVLITFLHNSQGSSTNLFIQRLDRIEEILFCIWLWHVWYRGHTSCWCRSAQLLQCATPLWRALIKPEQAARLPSKQFPLPQTKERVTEGLNCWNP